MKVYAQRFNLYLLLVMVPALICGCQTQKHKHKKNQAVGALRIHLQANPNEVGATDTISVLRSHAGVRDHRP